MMNTKHLFSLSFPKVNFLSGSSSTHKRNILIYLHPTNQNPIIHLYREKIHKNHTLYTVFIPLSHLYFFLTQFDDLSISTFSYYILLLFSVYLIFHCINVPSTMFYLWILTLFPVLCYYKQSCKQLNRKYIFQGKNCFNEAYCSGMNVFLFPCQLS